MLGFGKHKIQRLAYFLRLKWADITYRHIIYMHTYGLTAWHSEMYLWGVSVPGWLALGRDGLSLVGWLVRVCPLR